MNRPRLNISSSSTVKATLTYPYDFSCNITVEIDNVDDGKVYGSTNCKNCRLCVGMLCLQGLSFPVIP